MFTKKIAIIQRIYPHYRKPIFSALSDLYSLKLYHGKKNINIPQEVSSFSEISKNIYVYKCTYQANLCSLIMWHPNVIIQEFSLSFINLYINFLYCKLFRVNFIVWGHGYDRSLGFDPKNRFSDMLRLFFLKKSSACILYSDDIMEEIKKFAPKTKFYVARNSIDSPKKENIFKELSCTKRKQDELLSLCFVARLSENKNLPLLCDVAVELKRRNTHFLITVIGDGECKENFIHLCREAGVYENFEFLGPVYEEERVASVIYNSDFMVIPAWCGLSINHSFCYGTPIATFSNQSHPPEIQFAKDGYNAILAETVNEMVMRLLDVKSRNKILQEMRENTRLFYQENLSINAMLRGFSEAIN